jgi:hypothetical protein
MQILKPISFLREHPEHYLPGGEVRAYWLAERVGADALLLGATRVQTSHAGDWWFVSADKDWLIGGPVSPAELFSNVVPFPEAGENSMRSEVLLGAFSDALAIATPGTFDILHGEPEQVRAVQSRMADGPWARVVAFRAGGNGGSVARESRSVAAPAPHVVS